MKPIITLVLSLFLHSSVFSSIQPGDDLWIHIDLWKRKLYLMDGNQILDTFPVGVGKEQSPTPIGNWKVVEKSRDWGGGFGPRWLGLNVPWGKYGIHGTNRPHSIGRHTSHGCIRLLNPDIKALFPKVPLGTRVYIEGPILGLGEGLPKTLVRGDRGSLVLLVQNRLRAAGYYHGPMDGLFGAGLEEAVKRYQRDHRLKVTAQIKLVEYMQLGLWE
ncbi:L,D-transpeptidase family protein [Polycladomyces sp. WAk]|uniref:L,D-transpeptidase family protein n=1 Tax=Polycladomyces zharkentensis TaxID=2807616 RepID=A0ABS2WHY9_9BACL|nr:L,D-transpeptidase family protein [Polycladomyces sp. WAk]MBN2909167.1 L,D-transpeptidase family protein [Polycladomyces sp. WAk]